MSLCITISQIFIEHFFRNGTALQGSDSRFGQPSSSDYWLDDVQCNGNENSIEDCSHRPWGAHDCGTTEAAKVICRSDI